jgi:ABC-type uncharacterized transport system permease subunit
VEVNSNQILQVIPGIVTKTPLHSVELNILQKATLKLVAFFYIIAPWKRSSNI